MTMRHRNNRAWIWGAVCLFFLTSCGAHQSITRLAQSNFHRADRLYADGSYDEAALVYRRLLQNERLPDDVRADIYLRLAAIHNNTGASDAALIELRRALDIRDNDVDILYTIGKTLLAMDRAEEADEYFRRMLGQGDDIRAYNGIGVTLDMRGFHRDAQAMYLKGRQLNAVYLPILNNLALSYVLSGDNKRAIAIFKEINFGRGGESEPKLRQNLAIAHAMDGNEEEARRISRIDLSAAETEQNINFFNRLRDRRLHALLRGDAAKNAEGDILSEVIGGIIPDEGRAARGGSVASRSSQRDSSQREERTTTGPGRLLTGDMELPERGRFTVQIGAYHNKAIAENTADQLGRAGFEPRLERYQSLDGGDYLALRLGDFELSRNALAMVRKVYDETKLLGEIYLLETTP